LPFTHALRMLYSCFTHAVGRRFTQRMHSAPPRCCMRCACFTLLSMRDACFTHPVRMLYSCRATLRDSRSLLMRYACVAHALLMLYSCRATLRDSRAALRRAVVVEGIPSDPYGHSISASGGPSSSRRRSGSAGRDARDLSRSRYVGQACLEQARGSPKKWEWQCVPSILGTGGMKNSRKRLALLGQKCLLC
jgi:hypothetical protein